MQIRFARKFFHTTQHRHEFKCLTCKNDFPMTNCVLKINHFRHTETIEIIQIFLNCAKKMAVFLKSDKPQKGLRHFKTNPILAIYLTYLGF